jgi:hypothetical protein
MYRTAALALATVVALGFTTVAVPSPAQAGDLAKFFTKGSEIVAQVAACAVGAKTRGVKGCIAAAASARKTISNGRAFGKFVGDRVIERNEKEKIYERFESSTRQRREEWACRNGLDSLKRNYNDLLPRRPNDGPSLVPQRGTPAPYFPRRLTTTPVPSSGSSRAGIPSRPAPVARAPQRRACKWAC